MGFGCFGTLLLVVLGTVVWLFGSVIRDNCLLCFRADFVTPESSIECSLGITEKSCGCVWSIDENTCEVIWEACAVSSEVDAVSLAA